MRYGTGISLIMSLLFATIAYQRKVTVIFERFETSVNDRYVKVNISLTKNGAINMDLQSLRLVEEVYAQLEVTLLKYIAGRDMMVMNRTVNYCYFGQNQDREQLWSAIMEVAIKSGNFTLTCPFRPGRYCLRNLTMTDYNLPNFIPDAKFRAFFSVFTENEIGDLVRIFKFSILGRVEGNKRGKNKGFDLI